MESIRYPSGHWVSTGPPKSLGNPGAWTILSTPLPENKIVRARDDTKWARTLTDTLQNRLSLFRKGIQNSVTVVVVLIGSPYISQPCFVSIGHVSQVGQGFGHTCLRVVRYLVHSKGDFFQDVIKSNKSNMPFKNIRSSGQKNFRLMDKFYLQVAVLMPSLADSSRTKSLIGVSLAPRRWGFSSTDSCQPEIVQVGEVMSVRVPPKHLGQKLDKWTNIQ